MSFVHGVEVIEIKTGPTPVQVVLTSVIALVGCAPMGPRQQLIQVLNANDAAQFGAELPGFNIPEALAVFMQQGVAPILVVNVYDPTLHNATVTNEAVAVGAEGKFRLAFAPMTNPVIRTTGGSPVTLIKDTDYSIDEFGRVRIINRVTYPDGTNLLASYERFNPALVTSTHIVGTVGSGGVRTGMKLFPTASSLFGYKPKLIIAPRYSTLSAVQTEMRALSASQRALAYFDSPVGLSFADALTSRGPSGNIGWNIGDEKVELLYPQMQRTDPNSDSEAKKNIPFSITKAAIRSWTDKNFGYWYPDSNKPLLTEGVERVLTDEEIAALNAAGITTYKERSGSGKYTWGQKSSAFPGATDPAVNTSVRRTVDIIYDSLELAMIRFIGQPISPAIIDEIRLTCQSFIDTLVARGALVNGSQCIFDPADNNAISIAAGQLTFTLRIIPPVGLERLTLKVLLDSSLLQNIVG